jgi:hypothetical protein
MPIDMSAAKAPPKRRASSAVKTAAQVQPEISTLNQRRTQGLIGLAQLGQGLCLMMGQYADAAAIGRFFPPLAQEVANVADTADVVAKPIDFLIEVGPYGALIAAGMPLVMQLMANHGALDASRLGGQGVVPPEVLDAQMRAQMAQMQTEALKQQQQAIAEAQRAQREFEEMMADEQMAQAERVAQARGM